MPLKGQALTERPCDEGNSFKAIAYEIPRSARNDSLHKLISCEEPTKILSPFGVIPSDTLLCTSSDSESSERRHDEESTAIEHLPAVAKRGIQGQCSDVKTTTITSTL